MVLEPRRPPPNIDPIRKAQGSVGRIFPGGKGGNKPIYLAILVLVVLWALSGLYRVLPDEQGVVLRFGEFTKSTQPGLNYHIPFPVERVLTPKLQKLIVLMLVLDPQVIPEELRVWRCF